MIYGSNVDVNGLQYDYVLIGKSVLNISKVEAVIDDFCEVSLSEGRIFSRDELGELERIKGCPGFLASSEMLDDIRPYALPFFDKESLKSSEGLDGYGEEDDF